MLPIAAYKHEKIWLQSLPFVTQPSSSMGSADVNSKQQTYFHIFTVGF